MPLPLLGGCLTEGSTLGGISREHIPGQGESILPPPFSWHVVGQPSHCELPLTSRVQERKHSCPMEPLMENPGRLTQLTSKVQALLCGKAADERSNAHCIAVHTLVHTSAPHFAELQLFISALANIFTSKKTKANEGQ